jgi:hypothetical protein
MMSDQPAHFASSPSSTPSSSRACRSVKLAWTDERSGEQLIVSIRGGAGMLDGLAAEGFAVVDGALPEIGSASVSESTLAGAALPAWAASTGRTPKSRTDAHGDVRAT